jgi:hypothetical protein
MRSNISGHRGKRTGNCRLDRGELEHRDHTFRDLGELCSPPKRVILLIGTSWLTRRTRLALMVNKDSSSVAVPFIETMDCSPSQSSLKGRCGLMKSSWMGYRLEAVGRGRQPRSNEACCARLRNMPLILILVVLLLIFGGGGYYMGPGLGYYGGGGLSLVLLIVILFLLFGRGRTRL